MALTGERDHGLLSLVERLMGKPADRAIKPTAALRDITEAGLDPVLPAAAVPDMLEPQLSTEGQRTCNRAKMAEIILRALRSIEGCPRQGLEVTVYGERPWNAMLRITPAAGKLPDAPVWRERVRAMAQVLRGQYEVVE
ncbi:hypothetical protein [Tardiphaga sp.]|uniref:hypothetical protein n=1 Tax=Tardiphaga sp. TaxID=1926292 RepID=UPI002625D8B0|nr:hypothetical protein [Tardiphaga sp.]MDB5619907.1 hypothetical protein [Tardiphaga sp.]